MYLYIYGNSIQSEGYMKPFILILTLILLT